MDWRLIRFTLIAAVYALALLLAGLNAFRQANPQQGGMEVALLPMLLGLALLAFGVMGMWIRKDRLIGMIGIHAGLLVPPIAAIALLMRAWSMWRNSGLGEQAILFLIVGAFGGFVFAAMLRTRPPREQRQAPTPDA
ncbi:MAG: hypothetical protein RLZZ558_1541 [Planctomycetota bacterium]|jgi:hypothetical protein